MYCTSTQLRLLNEQELVSFEIHGKVKLPKQYREFMKTYGDGTYSGAICINIPDFNLLSDFADYDFWNFENVPITQKQLNECIVIGNSIDGDYIAIHPNLCDYIILPRHSDRIELIPYCDENFIQTIHKIGRSLYDEPLENYFEPAGAKHVFLRYTCRNMSAIAGQFKAKFQYDYLVENDYTCEVFLLRMGGYVRFNLTYGTEIAIFYCDYGTAPFQEIKNFLLEHGCSM